MVEPPQNNRFLLRLATRLLTKAERSVGAGPVRLKLDRREAPELFAQTDAEEQQRLELQIEALCGTGWVSLRLAPLREFAGFVDRNPQLELLEFDSLAAWAGYTPLAHRWQRQWRDHLLAYWATPGVAPPPQPGALLEYLTRNPLLALDGLPLVDATRSLDVLQALCASGETLPLREASARVFHGRSKILDSRDELLRLLGAAPGQFLEAPIQLLLDIPASLDEVLFIENLVTFEHMADQRQPDWQRCLLVYAAGFKGSARRLRTRQGCRLYVRSFSATESEEVCPLPGQGSGLRVVEEWLFGDHELPVRFFGDLDYAGMQILCSLREVFAGATAWEHGYSVLAFAVEGGGGHLPEQAAKEMQSDPGQTGCAFADQRLLTLMRETGRFMDQEAFSPG